MAKRNNVEDPIVDIEEVTGQAQSFFEQYQTIILGVVGGIAVVVAGFFAYTNFYQGPREEAAMTQLFQAEFAFQQDSFNKAMINPGGGYLGLVDIADQYSNTKAGNLAKYYAGVSCLKLGTYDKAIRYLSQYKAHDELTKATKLGMLGDAYSELGQFDKALSQYKSAANASGDDATAPYYLKKAGMLAEKLGKNAEALKLYEKIQADHSETEIGKSIGKYIARLK